MSWVPGDLIELQTKRFVLRTMHREDVTDTFTGWLADPEVMQGLNLPRRKMSRAQAVRHVLEHDNISKLFLLLCDRETGQPVGFFTVNIDAQNQIAETAVVIGEKSYWGQNVVVEARTALLGFLFKDVQVHKVIGRPHGRNMASIFNYKIMGFTCEAVLREQSVALDRQSRLDQLVFGMLRSEWQARSEGPE